MGDGRTRVLVAGATGYIGGGVARALHEAGFWVRALARDAARLADPAWYDDVFIGQATRPATLKGLCDGVDTVFSSIGIHSFTRRPTLWEVDYQANLNILEEAKASGVEHFVFVSVLHAERAARATPLADARNRVSHAIVNSGLDYNIFEPTACFNDMKMFFEGAKSRGIVRLFGDGTDLVNPLCASDLGEEVVRVIQDRSLRNQVREVGGCETLSYRQMAELAFQAVGKPADVRTNPLVTPWMLDKLAWGLRPFNYNAFALLKYFAFALGIHDMRAAPIGRRRLGPFLQRVAVGQSMAEAENDAVVNP